MMGTYLKANNTTWKLVRGTLSMFETGKMNNFYKKLLDLNLKYFYNQPCHNMLGDFSL